MSTIKISQLSEVSPLNPNTANVVFVVSDTQLGTSGKMTAATLAAGLYANTALNVGNNAVIFPGTIGQFASNNENYLQINLQNLNGTGSSDFVATADIGTDEIYFIDVGIQGSEDTTGILKPLDGYLIVQGNTATSPGGNLIIGTETTHRDIVFVQGGLDEANQVAVFSYNDGLKLLQKQLTFADGSTQNTSMTWVGSIANNTVGVDATQNTRISLSWTQANTPSYTANSGATYANGAFTQANAAFTKANNALANTSGTLAGDLTITGNTFAQAMNTTNLIVNGTANVSGTLNVVGAVSMNATLVLANSNFTASEAALTITASPTVATPSNDGYMLHISGKSGVPSRIVADSYGTGAYSVFASRAARGTVSSPTAVQSGDIIGRFSSNGFGTTKYQQFGTGRIDFLATENYTDTATGSQIKFWNCPVGSNTLTNILTLNGDSAQFSGVVSPEKGFIYTPRVLAGNTSSLVIDFATDSMVKMQCNADCTISFTNYTAGKVVEVWMTNVSGSGHSVTHGVSATNATNNQTTKTIPATSSMKLQYFSIDSDLANTFVAITQG